MSIARGECLNRNVWPNMSFQTENPIISDGHVFSDVSAFHHGGVEVLVICPHIFFAKHMPHQMKCPGCDSSEGIQFDGWTKGFRKLTMMSGRKYIKARRYRHVKCPFALENGGSDTCFSSLNLKLLETWYPPSVRNVMEFRVFKKRIVHRDFIRMSRECKMHMSVNAIHEMHKTMQYYDYYDQMKNYMLYKTKEGLPPSAMDHHLIDPHSTDKFGEFTDLNGWDGSVASPQFIKGVIQDEIMRIEPLMSGQVGSLRGRYLKIDHTFYVCKFGRDGAKLQEYSSLFTVMNEYAEVIAFYFCDTKSLNELSTELNLLNERLNGEVRAIWTDNPRGDSAFLKNTFGEDVIVKRDLFHVLQDYYKMCFKHPMREMFMSELSDCFFSYDADDILKRIDEDVRLRGLIREELCVKPPRYWKGRVRRYVVNEEEIENHLEKVLARYWHRGFFKVNMGKTHASIITQLKNGWLTDPPNETCFINIGTIETPKYITIRGTSQLESFHSKIRSILHGPTTSRHLLHALVFDFIYRWNIRKAEKNRNMNSLRIYDPQLANDLKILSIGLNSEQIPSSIRKYCLVHLNADELEPFVDETFGIIRFHYAKSTFRELYRALRSQDGSENIVDLSVQEIEIDMNDLQNVGSFVSTEEEKKYFLALLPLYTSTETITKQLNLENVNWKDMSSFWNEAIILSWLGENSIITDRNAGHAISSTFNCEEIFLKMPYILRHMQLSLRSR
jgi:hypothetical protein